MTPQLRAGLVEACASDKLLAFPLHPRQRKMLSAVEGPSWLHVWCCGRRGGKSTLAALTALHNVTLSPHLDEMVRPGEVRHAVVVATRLDQAQLVIRIATSIIERSPGLASLVESASEEEIRFRLPSGARTALSAFPCSSRGGRGWPVSMLLLDEAAHFIFTDGGPQTAKRVFDSLLPSVSQFGEQGRVIVASTPFGEGDFFHDLYTRASSGELPSATAQRATTQQLNPSISDEWLEQQRLLDEEMFAAEYLAHFQAPGDAFLDLSRFAPADRGSLAPEQGTGWIGGLDPAFKRDPFGIAILGRHPHDRERLLLGHVEGVPSTGEFGATVDRVAAVLRGYGVRRVVTDQHCDTPLKERLEEAGFSVKVQHVGAADKTAMYAGLRTHLYQGRLEIPDDPDLLGELRRLRTKTTPQQAQVLNPRVAGSHGDQVSALALAVAELRGKGGSRRNMEIRSMSSDTSPYPAGDVGRQRQIRSENVDLANRQTRRARRRREHESDREFWADFRRRHEKASEDDADVRKTE
jgi:hypothetical protein